LDLYCSTRDTNASYHIQPKDHFLNWRMYIGYRSSII
jgi:hypothetical protein